MRATRCFPLVVALAAACGRTGLSIASDDDAVQLDGGRAGTTNGGRGATTTNGGRAGTTTNGGRGGAGGIAGFLGVLGTAASGSAGLAGSGLTHGAGRAGANEGGAANELGHGGEAGAPVAPSCVVRVEPVSGNDGNDGETWARAVATVTRALSLARADCEIWIAGGTYLPTSDGNRKARFQLPRGVALRGGFNGDELAASDRSFTAPLPILSGNIGAAWDATDNSNHVVVTEGDATLDHVRIDGGYADDGVNSRGAAIAAAGALTLDTCTVTGSHAEGNGGAVVVYGALTLQDSSFSGNSAGNYGGALFADGSGAISITHTQFENNSADDGGAVYVATSSDAVDVSLASDTFEANVALGGGGAVFAEAGLRLAVSDSTFTENTATLASALEAGGPLSLYDTTFTRNQATSDDGGAVHATDTTTVTRSNFEQNVAGALVVEPDAGSCALSVMLTGFSSNSGYRGGAIAASHCRVDVTGSDFEDNTAEDDGGAISAEGTADGYADGLAVGSSNFLRNSAQIFGGAVYTTGGHVVFSQSNFSDNGAPSGGAIMVDVAELLTVSNSTLTRNDAASLGGALFSRSVSSTHLINTLVAQNTAESDAAAVYAADTNLELTNVTVADNVSAGGAAVSALGPVFVANSIFWNDTPSEFALATSVLTSTARTPNLVASNLSGSYPALSAFDPNFVDAANADYRLSADSPCIDSADDREAPATDILGFERAVGRAAPCPACTSVADMGAYEYGD